MRTEAVALLLLVLSLPLSSLAAEPVPVVIAVADEGPADDAPAAIEVRLRCIDGAEAEAPTLLHQLPSSGEATLELSAGSIWEAAAVAPNRWAAPLTIDTRRDHALHLTLYPAATVSGRIVIPPAEGAAPYSPQALELTLASTPRRAGAAAALKISKTTIPCPLAEEGAFTCTLPAATLDLQLRAPGFVPHYLWGLVLQAGDTRRLGAIRLARGSSVAGWVEIAGGTLEGEQDELPKVSLTAATAQGVSRPLDPAVQARLQIHNLETRANDRGFFQLTGVAPGSYMVQAEKEGYAPTTAGPATVIPGEETFLSSPLQLQPPATVELVFEPPFAPDGSPWSVMLVHDERRHEIFRGQTDLGGWWSRTGLRPGQYRLMISGEDEARWRHQMIEVEAGGGVIPITLPLVSVEGLLLRDEEEAAGILWFGGRHGGERVRFTADDEGAFSGVLPRDGSWILDVSFDDGRSVQRLEEVEVEVPDGARHAELRIEVAATSLRGEVVDAEGEPVPAAQIMAISAARRSREGEGQTDSEGHFELVGLRPGVILLQAEADDRASDWQQVEIEKGETPEPLRLVLRDRITIEGEVVAASGPVPGALVKAIPHSHDGPAWVEQKLTGLDGRFSLTFPAEAQRATVLVYPPGYSLEILPLELAGQAGRPLTITVQQDAASLTVASPGGEEKLLLMRHGAWVTLDNLQEWRRINGLPAADEAGSVLLPRMASGDYALCPAGMLAAPGKEATCARGFLPPGGSLALALPPAPDDR